MADKKEKAAEREQIRNYEIGVVKERIMRNAARLEELGYKRDARTLWFHRYSVVF